MSVGCKGREQGVQFVLCAQWSTLSIQPHKSAISPSILLRLCSSLTDFYQNYLCRVLWFGLGTNGAQGVLEGDTIRVLCAQLPTPTLSIQPHKSVISPSILLHLCSSIDCFLSELARSCPLVGWFGCQWGARGDSRGYNLLLCAQRQTLSLQTAKVPHLHQ